MKRLIPLCAALAALAAVVTVPARAEAFVTGRIYEVYIFNGLEKIDTGKLHGTSLFEYVDDNGYEACLYIAKWISPLGVSSPIQLFFDEKITPGYADCEVNSTIGFPTLIVNSPDYENSGVNKFLQGESIQNMVLAEDEDGSAFGVIMFDTNFPYPLLVEPSTERDSGEPGASTFGDR